jgi:hypothetical protein
MRRARNAAVRDLAKTLGPALAPFYRGERRELLTALHVVCSWPSWETLRAHHRLSPRRARAIITRVAMAVLAQAQWRVKAHGAIPAERSRPRSEPASFSVH